MIVNDHAVPESLRAVVLLARMHRSVTAEQIAHVLSRFDPPIDPDSTAWTALRDAVDAYDHDLHCGVNLTAARRNISTAAAVLLQPAAGCAWPR